MKSALNNQDTRSNNQIITNNQISITKERKARQFAMNHIGSWLSNWLLNIGICLVIVSWLLVIGKANAQLSEIGVNPFRAEVGSRPLGMGAAFVGLGDDVNTLLYNPAGLAWVKGISVTLKDFENVTGIQAYPTGYNAAFGLGIVNTKYSQLPLYLTTGEASSTSSLVLISYGTKLTFIPALAKQDFFRKLGLGFSLKGLYGETLSRTGLLDRSATGWDLDLGMLYKGADWWTIGASFQNILPAKALGGGEIKWDVGPPEGIPASFKVGGSAKLIGDIGTPIFLEGRELILAGELDLASASPILFRVGGEWSQNKTYFLRTGVMQQSKPGGTVLSLNFGAGYRFDIWGFDFVVYREPLRDEYQYFFSVLYFPKEWIVVKKLEVERPLLVLEKALEKISLEDNAVVYDDKIEVSGKVKPGVEIYVNGLRAYTAEDQSFKVVVPLEMGKNLILVEAHYLGEKKSWKYKVLRKAKVIVAEEKIIKKELQKAVTPEVREELKKKEEEIAKRRAKVEELVTLGVIEVTPEAEFKLEASITRGELATWLVKASGLPLPKVDRDVALDIKRDHPLAPFVKAAIDWEFLKLFPDGTFRPNVPVTKEEGEKLFKLLKVGQK